MLPARAITKEGLNFSTSSASQFPNLLQCMILMANSVNIGRDDESSVKRPGLDRLLKAVARREVDMVAAWPGRAMCHM